MAKKHRFVNFVNYVGSAFNEHKNDIATAAILACATWGASDLICRAIGITKLQDSLNVLEGYACGYENGLQAHAKLDGISSGAVDAEFVNPFEN